jgi:hypothetical protein
MILEEGIISPPYNEMKKPVDKTHRLPCVKSTPKFQFAHDPVSASFKDTSLEDFIESCGG